MNKLTYFMFLEVLGFIKHYQAPRVADSPEQPPLEPMFDRFEEAILNEIESGAVHPIVISPDFVTKHQLTGQTQADKFEYYLDRKDIPFEIPMPFDSVWVEFLPDRQGNITPMLGAAMLQFGKNANPAVVGYLLQRLVIRDEPAYSITAFIIDRANTEVCTVSDLLTKSEFTSMQLGGAGYISMYGLVWQRQLFDILNLMCSERQVGLDKAKTQVRSGKGKLRRLLKVKNIVYVVPPSDRAAFNKKHGTFVDWTHRWEVRGHWRKVEHMGKDPEGNYCVPGLTWVRPSVKGPEKAPLVQKTRYALPAKEKLDVGTMSSISTVE